MKLLVAICFIAVVVAQLEHDYPDFTPKRMKSRKVIELPRQNNAQLLAEEEPLNKVFLFGKPVMVNVTMADGEWQQVDDNGRVWSVTFHSEGATSMNIHFDRLRIPKGAAMWFIGRDEVQGAYTEENNYPDGVFGDWPLMGDEITIVYYQPLDVLGALEMDICHVVHGYKEHKGRGCNDSGFCNINAVCDPQYGNRHANEICAGGILLNGAGNGYCSGSMINTVGNTGRQLFLTAAHCGTSHTAIGFNWRSTACTPTNCPPISQRVSSLQILQRFVESDFTILQINEPIPAAWNIFLAGFSAVNTTVTGMSGIHHPSADVQKMAYSYQTSQPDRWSGSGPSTHWRVPRWDEQSTTEGGSSGSPLYDNNIRIIGQLHGGSASCFNMAGYDTYGAVSYSWGAGLRNFLDPGNSGQLIVDGIDLNAARK